MNDNENVREILSYDPLAEAEKITGKSYKDDDDTARIGLFLSAGNSQVKKDVLTSRNDSHFGMTFEYAERLFADLGFSEIYRETFVGSYSESDEFFVILWHPDGILAHFESWGGVKQSVNSAKIHYNVRFNEDVNFWRVTSSGGMTDGVWCGDHDAREGVRFNINALREAGTFVTPWVKPPWLWLLNYMESRDCSDEHKEITEEKIAQFPEHVRVAMGLA